MYQVIFKPRAERVFAKLDKETQQRLINELERLAQNPSDKSNVKKIKGTQYGYRLRVGRWRVLYSFLTGNQLIEIVDIFRSREIYDDSKRSRGLQLAATRRSLRSLESQGFVNMI